MPTSLTPITKRKADQLVALCKEHGIGIRVTQGFRSIAEQNKLYAQGRTTPGAIVTNAKGGDSFHNYGVAFDICFLGKKPYEGPWKEVALYAKSIGLEWGGLWKKPDMPHFQFTAGYTISQFKSNKVDYQKFQ